MLSPNSLPGALYLNSGINFGTGKLTELKHSNCVTERRRTYFVVGHSAWFADLCHIRDCGRHVYQTIRLAEVLTA
jgi:hypothetical protein